MTEEYGNKCTEVVDRNNTKKNIVIKYDFKKKIINWLTINYYYYYFMCLLCQEFGTRFQNFYVLKFELNKKKQLK